MPGIGLARRVRVIEAGTLLLFLVLLVGLTLIFLKLLQIVKMEANIDINHCFDYRFGFRTLLFWWFMADSTAITCNQTPLQINVI